MIDKVLLELVINEDVGSIKGIYRDKWGGNRWVYLEPIYSDNNKPYYSVLNIKVVDVDKDSIYCIVTIPSKTSILTGLFMEVRYSNYLIYSRNKILDCLI